MLKRKGLVVPATVNVEHNSATVRGRKSAVFMLMAGMLCGFAFGAFAQETVYDLSDTTVITTSPFNVSNQILTLAVSDDCILTGKLDSSTLAANGRVKQLVIVGVSGKKVRWRADFIRSHADAPIIRVTTNGTFIVESGTIANDAGVAISVEAQVVVHIGTDKTPYANAISISGKGYGGASVANDSGVVMSATAITINPPGTGRYAITASSGIAVYSGVDVAFSGSYATGRLSVTGVTAAIYAEGDVTIDGFNATDSLSASGKQVVYSGGDVSINKVNLYHSSSTAGVGNSVITVDGDGDVTVIDAKVSSNQTGGKVLGMFVNRTGTVTSGIGAVAITRTAIQTDSVAIYNSDGTTNHGDITLTDATLSSASTSFTNNYYIVGGDVSVISDRAASSVALSTSAAATGGAINANGTVTVTSGRGRAAVTVAGSGVAINATGDVTITGSADTTATVTSGTGAAVVTSSGDIKILDAIVTSGKVNGDAIVKTAKTGASIYVGARFKSASTRVGAPGSPTTTNSTRAIWASAADGTTRAYIIGGTVISRGPAVEADTVRIGHTASTGVTGFTDADWRLPVTVQSDSASTVTATKAIFVNNVKAKVVQNTTSGASSEAALKCTDSVKVAAADSIVARGLAAAIDSDGEIHIVDGVIRSVSGTAVKNVNENSTVTGGVIETGATSGSYYAIHTTASMAIDAATVSAKGNNTNGAAIYAIDEVGSSTITLGGSTAPTVSATTGKAIELVGDVALTVTNGNLSNGGSANNAVIYSHGKSGTVVTISDGTITAGGTGTAAGAIVIAQQGNVVVNGGTITASGAQVNAIYTANGSVTIAGASTTINVGNGKAVYTETTNGDVVLDAATINISGTGTGIHTIGGDVTVGGTTAASIIATANGKGIVAKKTGGATPSTGTVTIDQSATAIKSFSDTAIVSDADVTVTNGTIQTTKGVAISAAGSVTVNGGEVAALGDGSDATKIIAILANNVNVTGGKVTAGTPTLTDGDKVALYAATGIASRSAGAVGDSIAIVGGSVNAIGKSVAISVTHPNVSVGLGSSATNVVVAGNEGRGIVSSGKISIATANVSVGKDATAISATGSKKVEIASGAVLADSNGIGIASVATAPIEITGGRVNVGNGGTAVNAAGSVSVTNAYIMVDTTLATTGTAVNLVGGALLTLGNTSNIFSNQNAIVSGSNAVDSAKVVVGAGATAKVGGILNANVSVSGASAILAAKTAGRLTVAANRTVLITMAGEFKATAITDTIYVLGTVNSAASSGGKFSNTGVVILGNTSNTVFRSDDADTFKNTAAATTMVITAGAKFNGGAPVTGLLAWADTLRTGRRGASSNIVIIPPVFAPDTVYNNAGAKVVGLVDTVYNVVSKLGLYLNASYDTYKGTPIYSVVSGNLPTGLKKAGSDTALVLSASNGALEGLLTAAGSYTFKARVANAAGSADKDYTVTVVRATPKVGAHFSGVVSALTPKVKLDGQSSAEASVPYTGKGISASFEADSVTISSAKWLAAYTGFGNATIWYEGIVTQDGGVGTTAYPRVTVAPVNAGNYRVTASFSGGANFTDVSSHKDTSIQLGTLKIIPSSLQDVVGADVSLTYSIDLPVATAIANVRVAIPNVTAYLSKYAEIAETDITSTATDEVLVDNSVRIVGDSALVFGVNDKSEKNNTITFKLKVEAGAVQNLTTAGSEVTVRATFMDTEGLTEQIPTVVVNYSTETLAGFISSRGYTVANGTDVQNVSNSLELPIAAQWLGKTVSIKALKTGPYRIDSEPLSLDIPVRPATPTGITTDSASALADDGKILGVTARMQYRLAGSTGAWTQVLLEGLAVVAAGTYDVRVAPTGNSFASETVTVTVGKKVSTLEANREIPITVTEPEIAVTPQLVKSAVVVTVGPNPVQKSAGKVGIFYNGSKSVKGTLAVFNSVGGKVATVKVSGTKKIGEWNAAGVPEGSYLLRGALTGEDGVKVKVSVVVGVK